MIQMIRYGGGTEILSWPWTQQVCRNSVEYPHIHCTYHEKTEAKFTLDAFGICLDVVKNEIFEKEDLNRL